MFSGAQNHWTTFKMGWYPNIFVIWLKIVLKHLILKCQGFEATCTTSCKNVETFPQKNELSSFKSLLVTRLWDTCIILTSLLPLMQSCSSKFWAWSCIASNFDKGWRGDHKHEIMNTPLEPKYVTGLNYFCNWLWLSCFVVTICLKRYEVNNSLAQKDIYKLNMHLRQLLHPMENNSDDWGTYSVIN